MNEKEFREWLDELDKSTGELPRGNPVPQTRQGYYESMLSHFGKQTADIIIREWDRYHKRDKHETD